MCSMLFFIKCIIYSRRVVGTKLRIFNLHSAMCIIKTVGNIENWIVGTNTVSEELAEQSW